MSGTGSKGNSPWRSREFWERRFEQGDVPWDLQTVSPSLAELERRLELRPGSRIIVPGAGNGNDALHFARLEYDVTAVDWSQAAVNEIRARARRQAIEVEILRSSIWEVPGSWAQQFDVWVEHTLFCAIDPAERGQYFERAHRLLKTQGRLLGVFFVDTDASNSMGSGPPFTTTDRELRELAARYGFEVLLLEPSPVPHASRAMRTEWWAHFIKRTS